MEGPRIKGYKKRSSPKPFLFFLQGAAKGGCAVPEDAFLPTQEQVLQDFLAPPTSTCDLQSTVEKSSFCVCVCLFVFKLKMFCSRQIRGQQKLLEILFQVGI